MMGGSSVIGRGSIAYSRGVDSLLLGLPYPIGMLVFAVLASRIQRIGQKHGVTSIPELMERRFGRAAKLTSALIFTIAFACMIGSNISATGVILNIAGGRIGISFELGAVIATVIFVLYTCTSGLFGVVVTDIVQFLVMMLSIFLTLPLAVTLRSGGVGELLSAVDPALFVPNVDPYLVGTLVTNLLCAFCGAEMWQRAFSAKSPQAATRGTVYGSLCFIFTSFVVCFLGIAATVLMPELADAPDTCIPLLCIRFLPVGLSGLCIAGLLSITMSSADSYLLMSARSFSADFMRTVRPELEDRQVIRISRLIMPPLAGIALFIALRVPGVYNLCIQVYSFFNGCMAIPCLLTLYWPKATAPGVLSGIGAGLTTCILWAAAGSPFGLGVTIPGCVGGGLVLVAVSLATCRKHPSVFLS